MDGGEAHQLLPGEDETRSLAPHSGGGSLGQGAVGHSPPSQQRSPRREEPNSTTLVTSKQTVRPADSWHGTEPKITQTAGVGGATGMGMEVKTPGTPSWLY